MSENKISMLEQRDTTRIEAFSDGVIAIIITIMVLEIHAPHEPTLAALGEIWPTLIAYILSFIYVAIYWVNHHKMIGAAPRFSVTMHWANMALLFTLSLLPISTKWLGQFPLQAVPTATYLVTLILPAMAYALLNREVLYLVGHETVPPLVVRAMRIKQRSSLFIYAVGIALAFVAPALSLVCAALVSVVWIVPDGPFDRLLTRKVKARHK